MNKSYCQSFLGARGLGARYLFDENTGSADPLSEENTFIIMTGPFTGTNIPSGQRIEMLTKSPLTNTYLCSSVGGDFGYGLKRAGYDGLIITKKAETPTYVSITDESVEIRKASHLWGKYCDETQEAIREEVGDKTAKVACIGPAGERLGKLSCIQCETRSAGRGGGGAVWGSKNLKAIVVSGSKQVEVARPDELKGYIKKIYRIVKDNSSFSDTWRNYGTMASLEVSSALGMLPLKNFQSSLPVADLFKMGFDAKTLRTKWVVKDASCLFCPLACAKITDVKEGVYKGISVEGPEYETTVMFGPQCGNFRMDAIIAANYWCDKMGLDTISTGSVIGFAMECFERKMIDQTQTDGVDLKFGNAEAMVELVKKIGFREGLGNVLAEGTIRVAKNWGRGAERFAMQAKGLEYSAYDPRAAWGMMLGYSTNVRGGAHNQIFTMGPEVKSGKFDRFSIAGKPQIVRDVQNTRAVFDSLQICVFAASVIDLEKCARLYSLITDEETSVSDLLLMGDRIYTLERILNIRDGITRHHDYPPARILDEQLSPITMKTIGYEDYDQMLTEFYKLRGWDQNGVPTRTKLEEIGMKDLAFGQQL